MQNRNNIQSIFYNASLNGKSFKNITKICFSDQNILDAYIDITNTIGYKTCGVDKLNIDHISQYPLSYIISHTKAIVFSKKGYTPKPVRLKRVYDICGETKIIAIPCIWDRLIQQCIKRILEPICEARFSNNSYGSRINRTIENAIGKFNRIINQSHSYYILSIDIDDFYSKICHKKLMRQLWSIGIRDKYLLWLIKRMLNSSIKTIDNQIVYQKSGVYQCGILFPLFGNIVLNELDHRIDKMWCNHYIIGNFSCPFRNGIKNNTSAYLSMKKYTNLIETRFVRYNNKIRILCNNKIDARRILFGILSWIKDRLNLSIDPSSTILTDVRKKNVNFLGFRIKTINKGNGLRKNRLVVKSCMSYNSIRVQKRTIRSLIKNIQYPRSGKTVAQEANLYNLYVHDIHRYYMIGTCVGMDCKILSHYTNLLLINRLKRGKHGQITKRIPDKCLQKEKDNNYTKSKQCRYLKSTGQIIYPIGYIKTKPPMQMRRIFNPYQSKLTQTLLDYKVLRKLYIVPSYNRSAEYITNRAKLYIKQDGRCLISGSLFTSIKDIHCHHILPKSMHGNDDIGNLILINKKIHNILHCEDPDTAKLYIKKHNMILNSMCLKKINQYRAVLGFVSIKL